MVNQKLKEQCSVTAHAPNFYIFGPDVAKSKDARRVKPKINC